MITSMASQTDAFGFINEGSTKRKEILAKFLDLKMFEAKHKLAKKDSAEMKGLLNTSTLSTGERNSNGAERH